MIRKLTAFIICLFVVSTSGYAGPYDIREMTPEVQNAISGRQSRYENLLSMKASGIIGESNRGYVEALKNDAQAASMAADENRDRKVIYQAIVSQNGFGPAGLAQVESVFADVQRDKARPGEYIQSPSGKWEQK